VGWEQDFQPCSALVWDCLHCWVTMVTSHGGGAVVVQAAVSTLIRIICLPIINNIFNVIILNAFDYT
jgi:hypothetical protein